MHSTRLRHAIAVMLSLVFAATVDTPAIFAATNPTATNAAASVKGGTGSSAPWGLLLAIFAAVAIFVIGGLVIALQSRREYLNEQARKAAKPRDD